MIKYHQRAKQLALLCTVFFFVAVESYAKVRYLSTGNTILFLA